MPHNVSIVHLNIAGDENQPNNLLGGILYFHFLNLEEEGYNVPGSYIEHHPGSTNPDATIKAYLFGHTDAPSNTDDSMADSLDD